MPDFQKEKLLVLEFLNAIDNANDNNLVEIISKYTSKNFNMKCTHPFNELKGADKIAKYLWSPIKKSFKEQVFGLPSTIARVLKPKELSIWVFL